MLPWNNTFDHFRPSYTKDGSGGTIVSFASVATNQSCQFDATGGSLAADRTTGDGMTQRGRMITEYNAIQNGDMVAIPTGSQNYYRLQGGDQPMLTGALVIPTTYYWDCERWRATV